MYYSLIANPFFDRGIIHDPKIPENISFLQGTLLNWVPDKPLIFKSNCDHENPPRHAMTGVMPVWSDSLIKAFREAGVDNIQAFSATIKGMESEHEWNGYNAVNIVGLVSALDEKLSKGIKIGEYPNGTPFIQIKPVLDASKIGQLQLFRLSENPLKIIVHEDVLEGLAKTSPEGGWGLQVEEIELS